jgi:hypothetical protein
MFSVVKTPQRPDAEGRNSISLRDSLATLEPERESDSIREVFGIGGRELVRQLAEDTRARRT